MVSNAYAQFGLIFHYSVEEGLPSSEIHYIIQDDHGYIWILSDKGISRYNGYEFENYSTKDGLTDNVFFHAFKKENGELWMLGHNKTITIISGEDPVFEPYRYNDTIIKYGDLTPKSVYIDENEDVLISFVSCCNYLQISKTGAVTNIASRCDFDRPLRIVYPEEGINFFYTENETARELNYRYSNLIDSASSYLGRAAYNVLKRETIFKLADNDVQINKADGTSTIIKNEFSVDKVGIVNENLYWISYRYGGIRFVDAAGEIYEHLFLSDAVSHMLVDTEGNYWFATVNNGVYLVPNGDVKKYSQVVNQNNYIHDLEINCFGELMIGFQNGDVAVVRGGDLEFIHRSSISTPASIGNSFDGKSTYYVTDTDLFLLEPRKEIERNVEGHANSIVGLTNGKMAFSSYVGILLIDKEGNTEGNYDLFKVYNAYERNGICYLGCYNGLYFSTDSTYLKYEKYNAYQHRVNDLVFVDEYMMLGTNGDGVRVYRNDTLVFCFDNRTTGGDFITKLYVTDENVLWVGSNTGLSRIRFSRNDNRIAYYIDDITSQLPCREVRDIIELHDTLWIGTSAGLYYLDLLAFEKKQDHINHNLKLFETMVNDQVFNNELNSLNYSQNHLVFEFAGISFDPTVDLIYRYKLKGAESKWNYTKERKAIYSNIAPGIYEFIVQLKGEHSNWEQEEIRIPITIHPPFWKTSWFIMTLVFLSVVLIYLFFRFRILLYNRDLVRDIMRHLSQRLNKTEPVIIVRDGNKDVRIKSSSIYYVKSDGNYLEIIHENGKTTVRQKIGEFLDMVPDPLEYVRLRRSFIVRIDKVEQKGKKEVVVKGETIPVGKTYLEELEKINF